MMQTNFFYLHLFFKACEIINLKIFLLLTPLDEPNHCYNYRNSRCDAGYY
ncbi:MAG: hypothetical protein RIS73_1223 [Bacteroidota bacterium]